MSNGTDLSPNRVSPVVDFASSDYVALRADFITYAQGKFAGVSATWTDFNDDQFAVVFLELMAYLGDLLGYQLNAMLREAFPATTVRRQNLINSLKAFGITLPGEGPATVGMVFTLDGAGSYPFTIGKTDTSVSNGVTAREVFFHPTADVIVSSYPAGGTVDVSMTEGEYFSENLIGVSDGTANQRWQYPHTGVIADSALEIRVGSVLWTPTTNFVNEASDAQVYKILQNDFGQTFAVFGDGTFGAVPATNAEIRATFRVGGGTRGNLNPTVIDGIVSAHVNVLSVTNPERSSGGTPEKSMKEARNLIPNSLQTLERAVTGPDYAALALLVTGVGKAYASAGIPAGSRIVNVAIAPSGGGNPTSALKNLVATELNDKRMVTNRVRLYDPRYRDLRIELLLHVNATFKTDNVRRVARDSLINTTGSGILDFLTMDFAAIDASGELLVSNTKLQDLFASQKSLGLDRVEVFRMDVRPAIRVRDGGNTGSGTVADADIVTNTNQRRRRFTIRLTSASTYEVYEQIVGYVSEMSDTLLTDDTKIFEDEGVTSYVDYLLQPDINVDSTVGVASVAGQGITTEDNASLFSLTSPGTEYLLYHPTSTVVSVGSQFVSTDSTVKFTLVAGSTPFISGDAFTLDIYPIVGDIRLRDDEFPQLLEADLITRTSGGTGV